MLAVNAGGGRGGGCAEHLLWFELCDHLCLGSREQLAIVGGRQTRCLVIPKALEPSMLPRNAISELVQMLPIPCCKHLPGSRLHPFMVCLVRLS